LLFSTEDAQNAIERDFFGAPFITGFAGSSSVLAR
jgi:hypothetical protein